MSRIIVADDSRLALTFYSQILDYLGHEVVLCENGREAVEEFRKKAANLMILDMEMPEMNGDEACIEIRKLPEGISTPLIIVSAHDDEKDIMQGLNAGANDYLVKPVKEAHLIAKLKTFLHTSALHEKDIELVKNHILFAKRFRIEKLIGYGIHSVVFMASDIQNNDRRVALKIMNENFFNENIRNTFIQLAEKIRSITSEYVLKIFECGVSDGQLYLVIEYASGGDLTNLLKLRNLSEHEAAKLGSDIIRALEAFSQKNIVHLDLKPENIMISGPNFKLGDFGLTVTNEDSRIPVGTELWSSIPYMSPESLSNDGKNITVKSDIYSLGITLYQALSGDNPFNADKASVSIFRQANYMPPPLKNCGGGISAPISNIIELMLNKAVDERPSLKELESVFPKITELTKHKARISETSNPLQASDMTATENLNDIAKTELKISREIFKIKRRILKIKKAKNVPVSENLVRFLFIISLILIFGSIGYLSFKLISGNIHSTRSTVIKQAATQAMCTKCGYTEEHKISDISKSSCSKCGAPMGYAYLCEDCRNVFLFVPDFSKSGINRTEYSKKLELLTKCPKCGSVKTNPIPISEETKNILNN